MSSKPTIRLYWQDDTCFENLATVLEIQENRLAVDRTCFFPGGGGQPADEGTLVLPSGESIGITTMQAGDEGVLWHICEKPLSVDLVGQSVTLRLNQQRRLLLMRYHTVLHILNTTVLQQYDGWITGVQIGTEQSRIDFKWEGFSPALCGEVETMVNRVIEEDHLLKSYFVSEAEFQQRSDLLRTLEAKPPIINGQVRVVEIEGFDAQACGGTHVHRTSEVGRFSIWRTENKGKINKRLYVRLA
ncbi:MAG: alanyl-tRNA editing protein [Caldilineaceae bacterium]